MGLTNNERKNYVIGRGDVFFAERVDGVLKGERLIGNTPGFSISSSSTETKHYSSARGVKVQDRSVPTQVDRSGKMTCDDVNPRNLAYLLLGSAEAVTVTTLADQTETFEGTSKGLTYQVGISAAHPAGLQGITITAVKVGVTAKTLNTDYTVDEALGRVTILETGSIADDADIIVEYDRNGYTVERVVSGSTVVDGALRVIEYNPEGDDKIWYLGSVKLSPDGDYAVKSDQDWQMLSFNLNVQEPIDGTPAIVIDGKAA